MPNARCPDCGGLISPRSQLNRDQRLPCPHCGTLLQVIETEPAVELDWVYSQPNCGWEEELGRPQSRPCSEYA